MRINAYEKTDGLCIISCKADKTKQALSFGDFLIKIKSSNYQIINSEVTVMIKGIFYEKDE